ncbi:hypothetical protein ABZ901_14195 [Actinacidiphila alni]|uniref:hypothetical protein n=1 Tax=Actinacidiphila alni TaxID=380248 RepID=UPI003400004D
MEQSEQPPSPSRRPRVATGVAAAVLAIAVAVVVTLVITGHARDHAARPGRDDPPKSAAPAVAGATAAFRADAPDQVVLDGVSGRVRVSADPDADRISVTYRRTDGGVAHTRGAVTDTDGLRTLTVLCGTDDRGDGAGRTTGACDGDLTLVVPERTGLRLRQTSGETDLEGLGGRLSVDAASDRLTAHALHPSRATFVLTSGSADIAFATPPASLAVRMTSASTALRLPAGAGDTYAVSTSATSADVRVTVPTASDAPHRVSLDVLSGSLAVLPG